MKKLLHLLNTSLKAIILVGPIRSYRIARRGAQYVRAFRRENKREPTPSEWEALAKKAGNDIPTSHLLMNASQAN